MQISVVRPSELGPDEIGAWHAMQSESKSLENPFLSPEFAVAVDRVRSGARVAVLTDGTEIAGFFPFERRNFGIGVPIGGGLNDYHALIHRHDVTWDPKQLLRACKICVWQFENLAEGQLPFNRYVAAVKPSAVIDLSEGFYAYLEELRIRSPQFWKDMARKARKLEREAGELSLTLDSRNMEELRTLMSWKSSQYHRNSWSDIFSSSWVVGLMDYLFSIHNDRFSGLLSVLHAGQVPIAAHFGIRFGRVLAQWFPAYDTRFRGQSPGIIQHLRMAEEATAIGVHVIDMGAGSERYKQTLKSCDVFVAEGSVARVQALGSAFRVSTGMTQWAKLEIRKHPRLFHAAERVLRR